MANPGKGRGRRRRSPTLKARKHRAPGDKQRLAADAKFEKLIPVVSFKVDVMCEDRYEPNGFRYRSVVFSTGDDVVLNSKYDETDDKWIGRIAAIRTSIDRRDVMVQVQWYWSRNDVAEVAKTFNPAHCAPYERIIADSYDYVSPYAFQAITYVYGYDEDALDPPKLHSRSLFVRTSLNTRKNTVAKMGEKTCICHNVYNPYPQRVVSQTSGVHDLLLYDIMHFCPRVQCRRWYHYTCLEKQESVEDMPEETRNLRLLAVDPDNESAYATFAYFTEEESTELIVEGQQMSVKDALKEFKHSPSIIEHLPKALLTIAQSPIVRCSGGTAGWAIGNVADVVLARRFVYAAIDNKGSVEQSEVFKSIIARERDRQNNLSWAANMISLELQLRPADVEPLFLATPELPVEVDEVDMMEELCADLQKCELLATPYAPYWDGRLREFETAEAENYLSGPQFVCPECKSAI